MECVMSVVPRPWPQPAAEIVAAVAAMYRGRRERPLPVLVRDKLGEWLADDQFAGAYGVRGKPGWPPGRLALVTIFQMAEDLTDRQAAEAVRTRIDWKYALGLGLAVGPNYRATTCFSGGWLRLPLPLTRNCGKRRRHAGYWAGLWRQVPSPLVVMPGAQLFICQRRL